MTLIYIDTYGCTYNVSDSEVLAGYLSEAGHTIIQDKDKAELIILNTCTVKDPSEDKVIRKIQDETRPIIVAGCVPQAEPELKILKNCSILGVKQLDKIVEVVEETLKGNIIKLLKHDNRQRLNTPKQRKNKYREILPISSGCLGSCSYCKTIHARKGLISFAKEDIIKQAITAAKEGVKELWVTSQDTGAWGKDRGESFPTLLYDLGNALREYDIKIRIGMINPEYIIEYLDDFIQILNTRIYFTFLHIPIQSGSNKVLKDMKRKYTIEEVQNACHILKTNVPNILLATDIIIGFPTETQEDFQKTLEVTEDIGFEINNISKFYARPRTPAAKLERLAPEIVKNRIKDFEKLFNEIGQKNKDYIGKTIQCTIYDKGNKLESYKAHMDNYKQVIIKTNENLLGKTINATINDTQRDYLIATLHEIFK